MDLAGCTTAVVHCDDTGTTSGVWPVVGQVGLAVLLGVAVLLLVRHRRRRAPRRPQRRAHVSATGELLSVEERPGP